MTRDSRSDQGPQEEEGEGPPPSALRAMAKAARQARYLSGEPTEIIQISGEPNQEEPRQEATEQARGKTDELAYGTDPLHGKTETEQLHEPTETAQLEGKTAQLEDQTEQLDDKTKTLRRTDEKASDRAVSGGSELVARTIDGGVGVNGPPAATRMPLESGAPTEGPNTGWDPAVADYLDRNKLRLRAEGAIAALVVVLVILLIVLVVNDAFGGPPPSATPRSVSRSQASTNFGGNPASHPSGTTSTIPAATPSSSTPFMPAASAPATSAPTTSVPSTPTTSVPSVPGGAPTLSSMTPASGTAGQTLVVAGANFMSSNGQILFQFGSQPAPTSCPVQTSCTITVPAMTGPPSVVPVTATTSNGTSNTLYFVYTQ
jgi:hypothetical protein